MWVLGINTTGIVQWGTQSGKYSWNATTTPYTYNVSQICGDWALQFWRNPGYVRKHLHASALIAADL